MALPLSPLRAVVPVLLLLALLALGGAGGVEVLSKSRLESCERDSDAGGHLSCAQKLVVNLAVPAGASGGESSLVTKVVEATSGTQPEQSIRDPPVITVEKSPVYALYDLTYLNDVAYKPEEHYVETRKCEPDAGANVVGDCERLWRGDGTVIEHTEPICCPCGPNQRAPSSCGNFFDKIVKGKRNTAHCVRFPGDWFHVWEIGQSKREFSIRVQVKKGSSVSEVVVSPDNRTVVSRDNFLRVNLVGDFDGYKSIPSFEDVYLVTPRKGAGSGQPQELGNEHSKWMLLERVRFGPGCNKIGVGYEAFQSQPSFCSAALSTCLNEQLWSFWESDQSRINRNLVPQYAVDRRFQRINQHPNAGVHSFSVGVTEDLVSNLLLELDADDIKYISQRSPGKITSIDVPAFEALSQVGTANVTTKNTGKLEASYRLAFNCLTGINKMEEQYYVMKPGQVVIQSFELHSTTDKAETYKCAAILKASDYSVVDRAECQFVTTSTVLNNGSQIGPTDDHKKGSLGFLDTIRAFWHNLWDFMTNFFTGKSCSWTKCSSLLDFTCHFQYICIGWILLIFLLLVTLPIGVATIWLLHQKGFFDPMYDWWEDLLGQETYGDRAYPRHKKGHHHHHHHHHRYSQLHGDHHHHHHSHHHHTHHHRRKTEPSHHRVLHRHGGGQQWEAEGHQRHRHDPALGVQHRGAGQKHRHGKAVAAPPLSDKPAGWPRGVEDAVEFREWRRDEARHGVEFKDWREEARHAEHGLYDGHRRHSRF